MPVRLASALHVRISDAEKDFYHILSIIQRKSNILIFPFTEIEMISYFLTITFLRNLPCITYMIKYFNSVLN